MSNQTQNRPLTKSSVVSIMNKRKLVPTTMVGHKVTFTIQGNGNTIDVVNKAGELVLSTIAGQEGIVLQKRIFNTKANSQLAMSNARTQQYLKDALVAEKAGKAEAASELFNQYLNATQVSFGILLPSAIADQLSAGVDIAAEVILVTTDAGSLLTIDPSTISIKAPEVLGSTSFNLDNFIDEEDEFAGMDRTALNAAAKAAKVVVKASMSDDAVREALRAVTA